MIFTDFFILFSRFYPKENLPQTDSLYDEFI
jgi:hypothetical protein